MRPLRYYIHYAIRSWFLMMLAPLQRSLMNAVALETIDGIKIVDSRRSQKKDSTFCPDTVAALELIKSADPRRYRRLQRELRFITNRESLEKMNWASYDRTCRTCEVDYRHVDTDPELRDWFLRSYASTLIHEATHGAIHSRCIASVPRLRVRIEKLCVTEANRFVKRLDKPAGPIPWLVPSTRRSGIATGTCPTPKESGWHGEYSVKHFAGIPMNK